MMTLKEQAIEFIKELPDDKLVYIMEMFKGIRGLMGEKKRPYPEITMEEIEQLRGIVRSDIDEKTELAEAKDEKYSHFS